MLQQTFSSDFYTYCESQSSNYLVLLYYFILFLIDKIFIKLYSDDFFQQIIQTIVYILIIFHIFIIIQILLSPYNHFTSFFSSSSSSSSKDSKFTPNYFIFPVIRTKYLTSLIIICLSISLINKIFIFNQSILLSSLQSIDSTDSFDSTISTIIPTSTHSNQSELLVYIVYTILSPFILKYHHIGSIIISFSLFFLSQLYSFLFIHSNQTFFFQFCCCLFIELIIVCDQEISLRKGYQHSLTLTQSINHLQSKLITQQNKYEEIKSLFGNVSHDLKSPLQAFILELDALYDIINSSKIHCSALKQSIDSILLLKSICDFMLILIGRAMDFTKSASGIVLTPSLHTVDLLSVLTWVEKFAHRSLYPIPIEISSLSSNICSHIITDQQWLKENLLCLVSNAQKFSTDGVITIKASLVFDSTSSTSPTSSSSPTTTTSTEKNQYVKIEVEDEGIGISDDKMQVLFQPFKQAQLMAGGTGLGLFSLSKRIECIGGQYGVRKRSDQKTGSCFWFTIPYRPDYEASLSVSQTNISPVPSPKGSPEPTSSLVSISPHPSNNQISTMTTINEYNNNKNNENNNESNINNSVDASSTEIMNEKNDTTTTTTTTNNNNNNNNNTNNKVNTNLKILLVEDSILIQKTTIRTLSREGYEVEVANNGLECLKLIESNHNKYDVILMDLHMPLMDGLEATKRLRIYEKNLISSSVNQHLVIGLSANSDEDSSNKAILAGMNDFIAKPLNANELKKCLEYHWNNQSEN